MCLSTYERVDLDYWVCCCNLLLRVDWYVNSRDGALMLSYYYIGNFKFWNIGNFKIWNIGIFKFWTSSLKSFFHFECRNSELWIMTFWALKRPTITISTMKVFYGTTKVWWLDLILCFSHSCTKNLLMNDALHPIDSEYDLQFININITSFFWNLLLILQVLFHVRTCREASRRN